MQGGALEDLGRDYLDHGQEAITIKKMQTYSTGQEIEKQIEDIRLSKHRCTRPTL